MNEVFNILAPVLALGLIGYFATRFGFFLSTHRDGLSKYVFDFAVPMLLFSAIVELEPPEASTADLFITYYVPLVAIFTLGMIASWLVLQRSVIEAMVIGLGSCFSNTVLLGIPLIPRALGDDALFPLFLLISVHGITVFTAVTVIIEIARGRDAGLAIEVPANFGGGIRVGILRSKVGAFEVGADGGAATRITTVTLHLGNLGRVDHVRDLHFWRGLLGIATTTGLQQRIASRQLDVGSEAPDDLGQVDSHRSPEIETRETPEEVDKPDEDEDSADCLECHGHASRFQSRPPYTTPPTCPSRQPGPSDTPATASRTRTLSCGA